MGLKTNAYVQTVQIHLSTMSCNATSMFGSHQPTNTEKRTYTAKGGQSTWLMLENTFFGGSMYFSLKCNTSPAALSDFFPHCILFKPNLGFHTWDLQYTVQVYITWRVKKHDTPLLKCMKWRCNKERSWTRLPNTR